MMKQAMCKRRQQPLYRPISSAGPAEDTLSIIYKVLRSSGKPLDPATRALIVQLFGHDFSHVHAHTNEKVAETARALNARAFTIRHDVMFGAVDYAPEMKEGKKLLAHELMYVVQQSKGARRTLLKISSS